MKRIGKFLFGTVGYARVLGFFAVMFLLSGVSAAQTVNINPNPLAITEGMSGTFTAVLSQAPGAAVNVEIPATTGLSFSSTFLQFNAGNWSTEKTVTVTASQDTDQNDETHTIAFNVIGGIFSASDLTVNVTDDDKPTSDLVLSAQSLTIGEGSTGTFDVKLSMVPSATVTVTLTPQANTDVTVNHTSLTFTTTNWDTNQRVTVSAGQDNDTSDDNASISLTASGGGYDDATGSVSVDVTDDDSEAFVLPSNDVSVNEGGSNTFNIRLATLPSGNVTVTLGQPANTDVTVGSTSLSFTPANWDQTQSVTVNAAQDADTADESASISVSASGGGYGSVTGTVGVDVTDDDTESFVLPSSDVIVNEGSNNTFTIRLATLPSASVTVTLTQPANTDVTVSSTSLSFTTSTWNVNQTVTVNAAHDADTADESASISVSASGGGYGSVTGTVGVDVTDDDTESFILPSSNVSVNEGSNSTFNIKLATLPSASVTVTLAQPSNGDVKVDTNTSMTGDQNTLTFTTSNWDQNQSVRVNAAQDSDLVDDSASISVSASGGGYGSVTGTVGVDVTDDDTGTLILPASDLAIDEGANSNFNVKLSNQPSANVTVTLTQPSNGDVKVDTNTSTNGNQTTLTFTSGNWNVDQSVRVTVSDDDDLVDESASISISASGGGFAGVSGSVGVDITDVDVAEFILPSSDLSVDENDSTTFDMRLSNQPSANVTVTLAQPSGSEVTVDTDTSTNGNQNTLTFTSSNWNQNQTVTVNAANDFDAWDDTDQTISVSATGGGFAATTGSVVVDVTDDDEEDLNLPSNDLSVEEGESTTFMVSLATLPRADITVTLAQPTGAGVVTVDTDTTTTGNQNTLTFTPSNWNASQTVTVSVGHDDDAWDHADVTISVSASGGNYGSVTGTVKVDVTDDDEEGLTLSSGTLSIDEGDDETIDVRLTTTPMGDVTVTLVQPGNSDIRVDIDPNTFGNQNTLTFTNMNWNVSQTARVYAEQDADGVDESASVSLTVSSSADSAYAAVTDSVDVDVTDDDEPSLLILAIKASNDENDRAINNLAITESATATFEVKLATEPGGGNVTVTLTQPTNTDVKVDTDTSAGGYQNTLTFTTGNWNTRQRVAVTVLEDDDAVDESASIAITASGADYGSQAGSMGVMVTDNDEVGLTLSTSSLTIAEGANQTFDVELATLPSGTVTVNLSDDVANADVTYTPSSLTFTGSEWDTAQTVTVSVAHDPDASDESARIALVATGGDYGGVRERVSVDVEDDDEPALVLTPEQMSITEGTNDTFDVKLATLPSANVSVTLTQPGNNDVKIDTDPNASGNQVATLLFTGSNWNTNQRVTINTSDDDDLVNDSASIALSASGGDYVNVGKSVSVTVTDNDTAGLTVSPTTFTLAEGGNGTFTVRLTQQPNANVSMTLAQPSNADVTIDKTSLTFTINDWDVVQTVRIRAAEDDDAWDDSASDISISTTGGGYDGVSESVSVSVTDNDDEALILPPNALEVTEGLSGSFSVRLATLPSASVTVTLTQPSNADVKVDTDPDTTGDQNTLTFTVSDWDSLKTVTVNVAEDDDGTDENASIALSASGGGYNGVSSTVAANVTDNDALRVIADPGVLNFTEGESGTFEVRLGTLPSGNVTVMLRQQESNADLTMDKSSLIFTPSTWHERQTVTVNAAQDDDTALDESIVLLSATGGDYGDVSQTMTIRVTDNDSPGLTVSPGEFELVEGTATHFLVRLAKRPNDEDETVMVTLTSSSPEVMIDKNSLTFTTGTWNTGQVVALEVAHDDDDRNESAVIDYTATGGEYDSVAGSLVVEVVDDDEPLAPPPGIRGLIIVEPQIIEIDEGTSKTIALKFDGIVPTSDMTLVLARSNKDISFEPSSLRFTPLDWNEEQYITVSAAHDSDGVDDTDIITFAALGIEVPLARMTVSVRDDEYNPPAGGARGSIVTTPMTLMLGESLSRTIAIGLQGGVPDREVIVSLRKTNDDITLSPFSLIFTPSNWFEEQIVTVSAAFDTDGTDDTDIITMVATGGGYDRAMQVLPITVIDTPGMLEASPETIELEEGGSAKSFTVGLGVEPIGTEAVIVSLSSSNPGIGFSPSSLVFTSNDWDRGKSVSARAAEGSNRQGGLDVITVGATGGNYAGVQSTISVKYIEDEVRIGRPTPNDPLRTHALGIPPAVSGDQSTLSISCRQDRPCAVLLDCTAQSDGAVFQGEIPGVIPGWGRLTLTARDIESYTGGSWSGKGRLGCALRSVGRITSQVWTRSGDGVLVNNSAYIRSYPEGDGHRADIESITSPDGFEKSNIRIRCMAPQGERCTSMRFDCYEDHGKHRRSEPFEIGSSIVRHMQSEELASMIDYRWRGMGMACELRSDAPFTVQVLTRTGGGGALVNNSGGGEM